MTGLGRLAGILVIASATLLATYAIILVVSTDRDNIANVAWRWAFLLAGWFPVVFLHELGHAIAARAAGWRVLAFHVAPWAVRLRPFEVSLAGYLGGPDVGGFVAGVPRTREANTKWRETIFIAGGPIASWLSTLALLVAAAFINQWTIAGEQATLAMRGADLVVASGANGASDAFLHALCIAFALYSCASALASTWPQFRGKSGLNDAGMVAALWREQRPTSLTYAYSMVTHGVPRRTWESWITDDLARAREEASTHGVAANFIMFLACMMERDDAGARETADALRTISADAAATRIAQAVIAGIVDEDQRQADEHLARIRNLENAWFPVLRLRQIAIAAAIAQDDGAAAINRIDDSVKATGHQPDYPGGVWSVLNARVVARARRNLR